VLWKPTIATGSILQKELHGRQTDPYGGSQDVTPA